MKRLGFIVVGMLALGSAPQVAFAQLVMQMMGMQNMGMQNMGMQNMGMQNMGMQMGGNSLTLSSPSGNISVVNMRNSLNSINTSYNLDIAGTVGGTAVQALTIGTGTGQVQWVWAPATASAQGTPHPGNGQPQPVVTFGAPAIVQISTTNAMGVVSTSPGLRSIVQVSRHDAAYWASVSSNTNYAVRLTGNRVNLTPIGPVTFQMRFVQTGNHAGLFAGTQVCGTPGCNDTSGTPHPHTGPQQQQQQQTWHVGTVASINTGHHPSSYLNHILSRKLQPNGQVPGKFSQVQPRSIWNSGGKKFTFKSAANQRMALRGGIDFIPVGYLPTAVVKNPSLITPNYPGGSVGSTKPLSGVAPPYHPILSTRRPLTSKTAVKRGLKTSGRPLSTRSPGFPGPFPVGTLVPYQTLSGKRRADTMKSGGRVLSIRSWQNRP